MLSAVVGVLALVVLALAVLAHRRYGAAVAAAFKVVVAAMALLVLALTTWAAFASRRDDTLQIAGESKDGAYDGLVYVTIREIDLRGGVVKADARIRYPYGFAGTGKAADLGVNDKPVATRIPIDDELPLFEVPLAEGTRVAYPHDHYKVRLRIDLTVPDSVPLPALTHARRGDTEHTLNLRVVSIHLDPNLRDWALRNGEAASVLGFARFELVRSQPTVMFVYGVLATPLLLVLAFSATRHQAAGSEQTSPLEFAAALLAVITLRQVLVPPDIAGFTTLDKLLGIEVAFITAATIILHRTPRSPAGPTPAG